jgi:hypothetical protein
MLLGDRHVERGADYNASTVAQAFFYRALAAGSATYAEVYVDSGSRAKRLLVGLYSDRNGRPHRLLAHGSLASPKRGAWNGVKLSRSSVAPGRKYWIALLGTGGKLGYRDATNGTPSYSTRRGLRSIPTTFETAVRWAAGRASAYVKGTTSSPSPPSPPRPPTTPAAPGPSTPHSTDCVGTPGSGAPNTASLDACGYPSADNTGVPPGTQLRPSGDLTVKTPGQVINGLKVNGSIEIAANNVTVENTEVAEASACCMGIAIDPGVTGTVLKYDTIHGTDSGSGSLSMSVYNESGDQLTMDHVQSYNADRILQGAGTVQNSYCLDNADIPSEHYDCIYYGGGDGKLVVNHNTLLNPHSQTSAVFPINDFGNLTEVQITNNVLAGGGYTLYGGTSGSNGSVTGPETVENNRFSKLFYPHSGYFGVSTYFPSFTVWSGNVWDDTNQTVPGP